MAAARRKSRPTTTKKRRKKESAGVDRDSRDQAIFEDLKAGALSYRQIAKKYAVSLPTVNNKARKFGISRGRRPGAKILVPAIRRTPGNAAKNAAKLAAGAKRLRTPAATAAPAPDARPRRKPGRPPKVARVLSPAARGGFADAFRELVLQYYPNISLKQFERLSETMARELA